MQLFHYRTDQPLSLSKLLIMMGPARQQTATATVATPIFCMMVPLLSHTYYIAIVVGCFRIFCRTLNEIKGAKLLRALFSKAC